MKVTKKAVKSVLGKLRMDDCTKAELMILLKAMCYEFYPYDYFEKNLRFRELKEVVRTQLLNIINC